MLKDYDANKISVLNNVPETSSITLLRTSISDNNLKELFEKVITTTKDIAVEEAKVDLEIEKTKQELSKSDVLKYQTINNILQKIDGNLTKEKADEYLKELIKK